MGLSERLNAADEGEIPSSCESRHWQCGETGDGEAFGSFFLFFFFNNTPNI